MIYKLIMYFKVAILIIVGTGGFNNLMAQQQTLGRVTDTLGVGIAGASIVLKGTKEISVVTDMDGNFRIFISESGTITVKSVGFNPQDVDVSPGRAVTIVLTPSSDILNEVVVVGYGTQKKVNLSGAVETVSAEKLTSRSTNNVGLALQGLVPNLNINPGSGQANATPTFNIRGTTSLNGGSPLILVDGVPTNAADFSRMNAADIENISILKDASSAAIYGARAAYGVILVTTKKGNTEKLTVTFNNYFNVRKPGRMPEVVLNPYIQTSYKTIMGQPWYTEYTEQEIAYAQQRVEDPSLPAVIPSFDNPEQWEYFAATDWFGELFDDTGTSNSHSVTISGRNPKASYYLGGEYFEERGLLKEEYNQDKYRRYNIRSHVDYKPVEWLTVGNNTSMMSFGYDRPTNFGSWVFNEAFSLNTLRPVRNPDGLWNSHASGPASLADGGHSNSSQYTFQTQFTGKADLIKDIWSIKGDYTAKYTTNKTKAWDSDRNMPFRNGPNLPLQYFGWDNYAQISSSNNLYTMLNLYTDFNRKWGAHHFSFLAGFSQEQERYEYWLSKRKDLISDTYPTPQLATGEATANEDIYTWAIRSGFFRFNYILKDRYILEANGRYDGSSRFPSADRFGFFPSFSGAWVVSEEDFFDVLKPVVSHMKFRTSYGLLGNQDVSYYQSIATMPASRINMLLNGEKPMGVYNPSLVSNSLTWEKVHTVNAGVDLNFLSNRLVVSGDVYRRETKDMLTKGKTLPTVLGAAEPKINAADLKTNGWDMSVTWNDNVKLNNRPFSYGARFILSDSRAFITRFDNPTGYLGDYYQGYRMGEIWGLVTDGFFIDRQDIDSHADQWEVTAYPGDRSIEPGDLKYRDLNGDGKINRGDWTLEDPGDFKIIGNSSNRYTFGLDLDATWNGFDLRVLLQGVGKKDWYPVGYKFFGVYLAPWGNVLEHNLDHWTPENPDAYFPRLKSYLANGAGDMSHPQTRYLQNAAYIRMKNITFGYTLPEKWSNRASLTGIRFYLSAENLFERTSLNKSFDPEALNQNTHPFQRSISFGLNVTL